MPDDNVPTPPTEPLGEPVPMEGSRAGQILKRIATTAVLTVGGVVVLGVLVAPTRCHGATRSARLHWQQRQQEIQKEIQQELHREFQEQESAGSTKPAATAARAETPPGEPPRP